MITIDNLFILLQKDKKLKRQFEILRFLDQKGIIAIEKLSTALSIHRSTLISDVDDLKEMLPREVTITLDFRSGYSLDYPENNTIDYYIAKIASNSLVYKIIDALCFSKESSIDKLSEKFFSSEPVITRLITHMNEILKDYNIYISKNKLKFVGTEGDIRTFLFAFYREFKDYYGLKSLAKDYNVSYEKIIGGLENSTLHRNKAKIFLWAIISEARIFNSYFIEIDTDLQNKVKSQAAYQDYRDHFLNNFKQFLNINRIEKIPETEIIWAYIVSLDCIEYVKENEIEIHKNDLYRFEDGNVDNERLEFKLHTIMKQHFNVTKVDDAQFRTIVAYFINISLLSEISLNFQKVSSPVKKYAQTNHFDIYNTWRKILDIHTFNEVSIYNLEDISVTLTMLTFPIVNNRSEESLNILFSFEAEVGLSSVLATSSKLMLVPIVHAMYIFSSDVTPEFIKANKIAVLISNFTQRNESELGCKIFHLSYLPTLAEWTRLRNKLISFTE